MEKFMETTKQAGHSAELQRLHDNHDLFTDSMGGLLLAPVDFSNAGLRVLDSATADGTWLRDLQSSIPVSNTYIGTDIEKELFPTHLPEGLSLRQHDFTKPWPSEWHNTFDLVHQRLGLAGTGAIPIKEVIANLVGLVKQGGWLELVELDVDGSKDSGPALEEFLQLMREIFTLAGVGGNFALKMRDWQEEAGLDAIEELFVDIPTGASNGTAELIEKSINGICGAMDPLIAMAKTMPTSLTSE